MYQIDPSRLDLAREFKANPFGKHSAELHAVELLMRSMPPDGRLCLLATRPREQWVLARIVSAPDRVEVVPGYVFSSAEDGEWTIFKLRWKALTGHDLDVELNEPPRPQVPQPPMPDAARAILAYPDRVSVGPGGSIAFKVSCHGFAEYRADIVRLQAPATGPRDAGYREQEIATPVSRSYPGRVQPLRLGSCVKLPALPDLPASFTIQVLAWPTRPKAGRQVLIGNRGFALCLDETGALTLRTGDGHTASTGVPVLERQWYRLSASIDRIAGTVHLLQEPIGAHGFSTARTVAQTYRLVVPAASTDWMIAGDTDGHHFSGKLEAPCVIGTDQPRNLPLSADALAGHHGLIALWDFAHGMPSGRAVDRGPNALHGRIHNQPTRAMTGHNWDGSDHDWRAAPEQYGAIHFHDDDIADAAWDTDFSLTVPAEMTSGIYAARLRSGEAETYVPFFVRPGARKAKLAFLAPTASYTVYSNNRARFFRQTIELIRGRVLDVDIGDLQLMRYSMGLSTYCLHSDGSGVAYGSLLRPVTNFRPKGKLWNFTEDLLLIAWLERLGIPYDVITDDDLHAEGFELLKPYQSIVTGTHPEYLTLEMMDALEAYLKQGGRMMYMGGNGFYWRIAYHPGEPMIVETRRGETGTRAWDSDSGENRMGFTGEMGGLWKRQGRPPNMIAGVGFVAQGFDRGSYYRRTPASNDPRAHFIFEGVGDELLGNFGSGAAGEEIDAFDLAQGSPRHALVVASSEDHSPTFQPATDTVLMSNGATGGSHNPGLRADMVFFECPGGGAVFSTGSIAYAGALGHNSYDNNIAQLTENVLRRFIDPTPFMMPED